MKMLLILSILLLPFSVMASDYNGAFTGAQLDTGVSYGTKAQTQATDIPSAGTIDLDAATGYLVDVTGTSTITAITLAQGQTRIIRFAGILTFTNSSSLVIQGGGNITTAVGDYAFCHGYAAGVVRCTYWKASGSSSDPLAVTGVRKVTATGQTAAFTMTLPAGAVIESILLYNTTANAVTGGIKAGITVGGTGVLTAFAVAANAYTTAAPVLRSGSLSAPITIYFDAVTSWNSANLNVTIFYIQP